MPLSPEQFHTHALSTADADGRVPLSRMTGWEVFPFEPAGLQVVPLAAPTLPEELRGGDDPAECRACANRDDGIWRDEHWRLSWLSGSGSPLVLMLHSRRHYDLPALPDDRAAELGVLLVHLARAVEALPNIARAHISRWGDGAAHLHVFVFARPLGFAQLRGTCLAIWDDLLPPIPDAVAGADAVAVARALTASYGGTVSE